MEIRAFKDPVSGRIFETEQELNNFVSSTRGKRLTQDAQAQIAANAKRLAENLVYASDFEEIAKSMYEKRIDIYNEFEREPSQKVIVLKSFSGGLLVHSQQNELMVNARVRVVLTARPPSDAGMDAISPANALWPFSHAGGFRAAHDDGSYRIEADLSARLGDLPLLEQSLARDWELQKQTQEHVTKIDEQAKEVASKDEQVLALAKEIFYVEGVFAQLSKNLADKRSQYNTRLYQVRDEFIRGNPAPQAEAARVALERLKSLQINPLVGEKLLERLAKPAD